MGMCVDLGEGTEEGMYADMRRVGSVVDGREREHAPWTGREGT